MAEMTVLICPKCQAAMQTHERSGVVIDQCTDCRGIFFDHGELEQLIDAEMMAMDRQRRQFADAGDTTGDPGLRPKDDGREHPAAGDDSGRGRDSRGRPAVSEVPSRSPYRGFLDSFGGD